MLNHTKMKNYADKKMSDGCNCCEAVLWSYLAADENSEINDELYKVATIFGGGIASSREEICGALTGALMVLSIEGGRTDCSNSNAALMEKGVELRNAFIEHIGPTKCSALRESLESKFGTIDCKKVVMDSIELLHSIESK